MPRLLVVDDEPHILGLLESLLKGEGYDVVPALDGNTASERLKGESFDLLLTDLRIEPVDGIGLLRLAQEVKPGLPVILLTGYASVETAIEAMQLGAFDYITKPFKVDELLTVVRRALESGRGGKERDAVAGEAGGVAEACAGLIAENPQMKKVIAMVHRLAPTDAPVLIIGEKGTGRESVARALHKQSPRKDRLFLRVDCAAQPGPALAVTLFGSGGASGTVAAEQGVFEMARGGTLCLHDVFAAPPEIQAELVRLLREKTLRRRPGAEGADPLDVRLVAVSEDLGSGGGAENAARPDLYKRLSVFTIKVPPLRERREDVLFLWHCLIYRRLGEVVMPPELSPEAAEVIAGYDWPGNIPEMEDVIRATLAKFRGQRIEASALPEHLLTHRRTLTGEVARKSALQADPYRNQSLRAFLREKEREHLKQVLAGADEKARTAQPPPER